MTENKNLVLFNGAFHTLNDAKPLVSAVAIRDGKLIYLGDEAGAKAVFEIRVRCGLRERCVDSISLSGCLIDP
jgi:predicted amidohydrolase YtcJ